ncbi:MULTISPECIES: hypothetical protein [unclassified Breznakia]|uniref:hypothetical protein n=1 Tax=unclassified Breznakia TaxID=2623764 RepID=UPI0024769CF6|nr:MULTISPECIES: hypothetical protein [unclassified Breznakia]MDH6367855.1 hypothetical protein [Breznakia sp. PH1-1]MDH6404943.1 hypothetical protein [Breznakia sp. PF1-11]MDH6412658.1 hypothetical protein [Breznakia sp. PFB1-11]MDH6415039.1 hypothetical protein [Breznakia sp. PFB1-14]MDH6417329.1 hypothetical protein [Breznakia sp. PFB1-4]
MKTRNIARKYNISEEELITGINIIAKAFGNISNSSVMLAIAELLANGDIQQEKLTGANERDLLIKKNKQKLLDYISEEFSKDHFESLIDKPSGQISKHLVREKIETIFIDNFDNLLEVLDTGCNKLLSDPTLKFKDDELDF